MIGIVELLLCKYHLQNEYRFRGGRRERLRKIGRVMIVHNVGILRGPLRSAHASESQRAKLFRSCVRAARRRSLIRFVQIVSSFVLSGPSHLAHRFLTSYSAPVAYERRRTSQRTTTTRAPIKRRPTTKWPAPYDPVRVSFVHSRRFGNTAHRK